MIKFEKFQLANGLRLIVHQDPSTPIVAVNLLYDVGARDEDRERTGFAHLFEHLMFGGSVNIPNYDSPLQEVGGENNAFTTNDITNYYITLPKQNLETALWLESDRMLSLAFTEKSLDVQRNVVVEEFKQRYLNQPYGDVYLLLRPLAYQEHPYQWPTIGKEISHIEEAQMKEVKDFFYRFYRPNNAVLSIAGDVDVQEVKSLVEKWFAEIPAGAANNRNLPKEPLQKEARTLHVEREVPLDAIYMAFHMCDRLDPAYYATDLLSDVLSRGESSRFYQKLVKGQALFTDLQAYITGDMDEGLFVVSGRLNVGVEMETAEAAIWEELEAVKKDLIEEVELQKVQNKTESSLAFAQTNILNKAMNLAIAELVDDAGRVNQEINYYQAVDREAIRTAAQTVLKKENSSTLYYHAKKS